MNMITDYYRYTWQWITTEKPKVHFKLIHSGEGGMPPFVVSIPEGRFWGINGGAVITPNHKVIEDISVEPGLLEKHFKFYYLKNRIPPPPYYLPENIAVVQALYGDNYFHFMFDVIARLDLIRRSDIPIQKYVLNESHPYQNEILDMIGIPKHERISVNPYLIIKGKELIVPSYTGSSLGFAPNWACDFLRNELLLKRNIEKLSGYERIYISREKAKHRKVTNENEIMKILEPLGFKRIFLENEPVMRKIQIFHSADVIVSPHGAGLTNLLFCRPETKVIEFFSPNWILFCFKKISEYVGLKYYYLTGKGPRYPMSIKIVYENIYVDIGEFYQLLKGIGL